jgi:uncharacterized membrane protein
VTVYEFVVGIHVAAAVVGFGATFAYPVIQVVAERTDRRALPFALRAILAISNWVAVPATVLVGATGIYQIAAGPYFIGDLWVSAGLALYVLVLAAGIGYLAPAYRRAERAARHMVAAAPATGPIELSPEYRAATRGPRIVGPFVAGAIIAIVFLMELKPT